MLVQEVGLSRYRSGLSGAPRDHVFHLAGKPALAQLVLEDAMDLRILVLVLYLMAAFLAAHLARPEDGGDVRLPPSCGVLARHALIHDQIGGGSGTHVEMLVQPKPFPGARE